MIELTRAARVPSGVRASDGGTAPPGGAASLGQRLYLFGCRLSDRGSNLAGHPTTILLAALVCAAAFILGQKDFEGRMALILSAVAITLTQMVLNQQRRSEAALHLKIDELIHSQGSANNEVAGIERREVDELEALRSS